MGSFQSPHPHGVRQEAKICTVCGEAVSIPAPAWGATTQKIRYKHQARVSIPAPAWGATVNPISTHKPSKKFQSPHPHGVRQLNISSAVNAGRVSIPAPAWGATIIIKPKATQNPCFNPRTRMGCDFRKQSIFLS